MLTWPALLSQLTWMIQSGNDGVVVHYLLLFLLTSTLNTLSHYRMKPWLCMRLPYWLSCRAKQKRCNKLVEQICTFLNWSTLIGICHELKWLWSTWNNVLSRIFIHSHTFTPFHPAGTWFTENSQSIKMIQLLKDTSQKKVQKISSAIDIPWDTMKTVIKKWNNSDITENCKSLQNWWNKMYFLTEGCYTETNFWASYHVILMSFPHQKHMRNVALTHLKNPWIYTCGAASVLAGT